jgi:hypothetical protein
MAEYNIHYRISYLRFSGGKTTIDILEKDYFDDSDGDASSELGPEIITLEAAGNPLEISTEGNPENIYGKPTQGSGATIRVLAQPLTLHNLFTTDPQKFIVKVYNGDSGENLYWQGFINTGIFNESYSTPSTLTHEITIYCNNGIKVLEDIPYTQTVGGSNYTGISTIATVMTNILAKINLSFTYVRTNHLLTYGTGIYANTTNIFTALTVNNENYYDEGGEPMSCREVIDSIFSALGLIVTFKGANIVIFDPLDLQDISHGHRYAASPFGNNETSLGLGEHLDIAGGDIEWAETGAEIDIIMPYNKISIKYDPYTFTEAGYSFSSEENGTLGNVSSDVVNNGISYTVYSEATMKDWELNGTGCYFTAIKQTAPSDDPVQYFIRMHPTATATNHFEYVFPYSCIKQDDNLFLELSLNVYINTRHATNIFDPAELSTLISSIYLYGFKLQIGDKFYNQPHGVGASWSADTDNTFEVYVREMDAKIEPGYYVHGTWFRKRKYVPEVDTSEVNDKWVKALVYIPLSKAYIADDLLAGSINLRIPERLEANSTEGIVNVLISDVNIALVNIKKGPITNDGVKTTGTITDALYMKKAEFDIPLTTGIGPYGASKGALSSPLQTIAPGTNITGLKRLLEATFHTTNELLLQSVLSQYGHPRFTLKGKLDATSWVYQYDGLGIYYNLIYDSAHLTNDDASSKKFFIVGSTYNDREETIDVNMVEIANSREAIV